jgi:hypothetical protein
MAGTLYIFTSESAVATTPARNAVVRGNNMIPLTAGQSFTFGGMIRGQSAVRDMTFGTGYTYILSDATPRIAAITYLKWSS